VATYHKQHGLPVAIVRPSLVTGLAGAPYPGYCGNVAGEQAVCVYMHAVRTFTWLLHSCLKLIHSHQLLDYCASSDTCCSCQASCLLHFPPV
jgi:hypothetical protein